MTSDERKGSEFWFTAPLGRDRRREGARDGETVSPATLPGPAAGTAAGVPAAEDAPARGAGNPAPRRSGRVLVAEDNHTNQLVAKGILEWMGLRVDVVGNGAEALKALEEIPYDLVLMDVQMPELDGLQATRLIRHPMSPVRNPRIPIIAMTANAMRGDRETCLEAGMNDYIPKPVTPQNLAHALEPWLGSARAAESADAGAAEADPAPAAAPPPAPAEVEAVPVFDRGALLARMMGDEDLVAVVIQAFLSDLPRQLEAVRAALASADTTNLVRLVHGIKGAAANVAGEALRASALAMETECRAGNLEAAGRLLPAVEQRIREIEEAMRESAAAA